MINIISKSLIIDTVTGPSKVVRNLILGLEKIRYPYVVNQSLDSCKRLYIHDDVEALRKIKNLPKSIKVVVGPNLYIWPRHVPKNLHLIHSVYLHPSKWATNAWKHFGYNRSVLDSWPTGIDTELFKPDYSVEKNIVLVYFKNRFEEELEYCTTLLEKSNIAYRVIRYGSYTEKEYKNFLQKSKYIIWIGTSESQGIGLLEALASNVPMLVWDVLKFGHAENVVHTDYYLETEKEYTDCTSAPYFDDSCGLVIKDKNKLHLSIQQMEQNLINFAPREFVIKNLNLEKQAKDFIGLYDTYFNLSYEQGFSEQRLNNKKYKNSKTYYQLYFKLKNKLSFLKKLIKFYR